MTFPDPVVKDYNGVFVVRDDLIPGGTKARYLISLFECYDEAVYATPAYGAAQVALAYCARLLGKRATLFVAKRRKPHPRTLEAYKVGAMIYQIPHGYLSNVQSKARKYCKDTGAHYVEFGGDSKEAIDSIGRAGEFVWDNYGPFDQVWTAIGSGVLSRGLQRVMSCEFVGVRIGADVKNPGRAVVIKHHLSYEQESKVFTPFPSCPNYDKKAWEYCLGRSRGKVLFWNVFGPSPSQHLELWKAEKAAG